MDTGTHLLIGATLSGLALTLAGADAMQHAAAVQGLAAAAVVGSNAPDFDTIIRLRGYKTYLTHHRGFSHSLPMLLVWPVVLAPVIALLTRDWANLLPIFIWTMAGVVFHVFLDFFNVYGVQGFRPVSRRWFHLDLLPIFDPILFALHAAGLLLWITRTLPGTGLFPILYALTGLFIVGRLLIHRSALRRVRAKYGSRGYAFLIPQWLPHQWKFVYEGDDAYLTGSITGRQLTEEAVFAKGGDHPVIRAAMGSDGVRAFLAFAHRVQITVLELAHGYRVEMRDVRFRQGQKLPFGVDVTLDERMRVTGNTLGWMKKLWEPPFV